MVVIITVWLSSCLDGCLHASMVAIMPPWMLSCRYGYHHVGMVVISQHDCHHAVVVCIMLPRLSPYQHGCHHLYLSSSCWHGCYHVQMVCIFINVVYLFASLLLFSIQSSSCPFYVVAVVWKLKKKLTHFLSWLGCHHIRMVYIVSKFVYLLSSLSMPIL